MRKSHAFFDLARLIDSISQKILAQQLRSLEHDRLLTRTVYDEKPIRVDYRLTA